MKDEKTIENKIEGTGVIARMGRGVRRAAQFILNPRLLLCVFIAWMLTNGWSYVFFVVGSTCHISWMLATATAYLSLLWLPFTPEKILTLIIAVFLLRVIFPGDEKTLRVLQEELAKAKAALCRSHQKRREKHQARKAQKDKKESL